jgi:hypothetical protein
MRDSQKIGGSYSKDDRSSINIDECACLFGTSVYLYGRSPASYFGGKGSENIEVLFGSLYLRTYHT